MKKTSIAVIGAGKVGSALAVALKNSGYPIVGVASSSFTSAQRLGKMLQTPYTTQVAEITRGARVVFITTPDGSIVQVAQKLATDGAVEKGQIVIHASGALSAEALLPVKEQGAAVAAFHPLQSFANIQGAIDHLPGSYFCLQGDEVALKVCRQMVADLKGHCFTISSQDKPLYHAAATVASNYMVAVSYMAVKMLQQLGLGEEEAMKALSPLLQGTLNNIQTVGPIKSLTGPVERGDSLTIEKHLAALRRMDIITEENYRALGKLTVEVALKKESISPETGQNLEKILEG